MVRPIVFNIHTSSCKIGWSLAAIPLQDTAEPVVLLYIMWEWELISDKTHACPEPTDSSYILPYHDHM